MEGFVFTMVYMMYIATMLSTLLCVVLIALSAFERRPYVGSVTLRGLLLLVAVPA